MNRERVLARLEPSYATKEQTFAEGDDVLPLLVVESKARVTVVGLGLDRSEWDPVIMEVARQERAVALFLIADVRLRVLDEQARTTYRYRPGALAEDPEHVEAMAGYGVDLMGAVQVIRQYRVDDRGHLEWSEPEVYDGKDTWGVIRDVLALALLGAQASPDTGGQ